MELASPAIFIQQPHDFHNNISTFSANGICPLQYDIGSSYTMLRPTSFSTDIKHSFICSKVYIYLNTVNTAWQLWCTVARLPTYWIRNLHHRANTLTTRESVQIPRRPNSGQKILLFMHGKLCRIPISYGCGGGGVLKLIVRVFRANRALTPQRYCPAKTKVGRNW